MAHEESLTFEDERRKNNPWFNVAGSWAKNFETQDHRLERLVKRAYMEDALKPLGNAYYPTSEEAVAAAKQRSGKTSPHILRKKVMPEKWFMDRYIKKLQANPEDEDEGMSSDVMGLIELIKRMGLR